MISQGTAASGTVNSVAPKFASFNYNVASQMTDLRRFSALTSTPANLEVHSRYAYDGAARLTSITHAKTEIAPGQAWPYCGWSSPSVDERWYLLSIAETEKVTDITASRRVVATSPSRCQIPLPPHTPSSRYRLPESLLTPMAPQRELVMPLVTGAVGCQ